MSVVATTLGIAARTSRPATASAARAATSATSRAGGRERSYQATPPTSTTPRRTTVTSCHLTSSPPPRWGSEPVSQPVRTVLRRDGTPTAEHAGDLGGEVPAAGENLTGWRVGDQLSLP